MVDKQQIEQLLKKHFLISGTYEINSQGTVTCEGHVSLHKSIKVTHLPVAFDHVAGDFWCYNNKLTSLQGAPHHVGGTFHCSHNKLTSLQGSPHHVGGHFYCYNNKLTSLQGAPHHVGGSFWCNNNSLTSLEGAPRHVGGSFVLTYDAQLPLLRVLNYSHVHVRNAPEPVGELIDKYVGSGKKGALACAAELVKAGFKANARW